MSASHARGLIPFCKENPRLRVERRAYLWRDVFLHGILPRVCDYIPLCSPMPDIGVLDAHLSESMARSFALWTVEALSLIPAVMPADSFSLVFSKSISFSRCNPFYITRFSNSCTEKTCTIPKWYRPPRPIR
ncbi:hypothetical protein F4781DRAFT_405762 [Annulohypoxylon bovei var. microspora]|nr:hypothetical protein F4781DRAFT_405762 [Annulohypoxylon bovei var. microspora]